MSWTLDDPAFDKRTISAFDSMMIEYPDDHSQARLAPDVRHYCIHRQCLLYTRIA